MLNQDDPSARDQQHAKGHAAHNDTGGENAEQHGPAAFRKLEFQFEELTEFALYYIAARLDAAKGSLWRGAVWAAVAILALVVVASVLAACAVVAILGVAEALTQAFGGRPWAGYLATGVGSLTVFGLTAYYALRTLTHRSRERTVERYAQRRHEQKTRFGHDVKEQARRARQTDGE